MEYFYSFLLFLFFWHFTTWTAVWFGELLSWILIIIAVFLGSDYLIIGIGGLLGNFLNIFIVTKYIKQKGAMSNAPTNSINASKWYVLFFLLSISLKYVFNISKHEYSIWYFSVAAISFLLYIYQIINIKKKHTTIDEYFNSVIKYKIVEKYNDEPKWATYLYFKDGHQDWNKTIKGSFRAKHPYEDLTYVFSTKDEATDYAKLNFENARPVED